LGGILLADTKIFFRFSAVLARNLILYPFSEANLHHFEKITILTKGRWIMFRIANETTTLNGCQWKNWTDEDLLLEYRCTGVRQAFEELVYRYERELYNYLYRYLGNSADAEDVFQKTFLAVLRSCDKFDASRKFRPWLYTIATNEAINCQRKAKRFRVISQIVDNSDDYSIVDSIKSNEPEPFAGQMDREIASKVREAVAQLPKQLKQVVYMVYFQGMTYREAADAVGIHFTALSLRLKKAVGKLNFMLKNVG